MAYLPLTKSYVTKKDGTIVEYSGIVLLSDDGWGLLNEPSEVNMMPPGVLLNADMFVYDLGDDEDAWPTKIGELRERVADENGCNPGHTIGGDMNSFMVMSIPPDHEVWDECELVRTRDDEIDPFTVLMGLLANARI